MEQLLGCGTALVTPFAADGSVDHRSLRKLVQRQLAGGVDFLVPLGSTGEAATLTDQEKLQILETVLAEVAGKIPVIAGIGSNSTQQTIANLHLLDQVAVTGFLVVTPFYNKPTQAGLYHHFQAVAAATTKPIVLYNVPGRTAVNLTAATTLRLAELPNIIAIKEASGNFAQISTIIRDAPQHFTLLIGDDLETLPSMAAGAHGVISVVANIVPSEMAQLTHAMLKGDWQQGRMLHYRLMDLCERCFVETNPIPVKAALSQMGLLEEVLRLPLESATPATHQLLHETLRQLELLVG